MARIEPLIVQNSLAGWISATFWVFLRAPVFFTLFPLSTYLSSPLASWIAPPSGSPSYTNAVADLLISQALFALVQAPMLERAARLVNGEPVLVGRLFGLTVDRTLPMIMVVLVQLVLGLSGAIAFLIPGIIALVTFDLAGPICVAERAGPFQSLHRSAVLTRHIRWRLFGAFLCLILPFLLTMLVVTLASWRGLVTDIVSDIFGAMSGAWTTILSAVAYDAVRPMRDKSRITAVFA